MEHGAASGLFPPTVVGMRAQKHALSETVQSKTRYSCGAHVFEADDVRVLGELRDRRRPHVYRRPAGHLTMMIMAVGEGRKQGAAAAWEERYNIGVSNVAAKKT